MSLINIALRKGETLCMFSIHYRYFQQIFDSNFCNIPLDKNESYYDAGFIFVDASRKIIFNYQNAFDINKIKKEGWLILDYSI